MGLYYVVFDIMRANGVLKGIAIILDRGCRRFVHAIRQQFDTAQAFMKWFVYYLKCSISGRRLVFITLIEHLGDIVACEPVVRYIRTQEPDAFIVWCVKKDYDDIVRQLPDIDGIVHAFCLTTWIVLRRWASIDRIIDLHVNGRTCSICRIPLVKKVGYLSITLENYYRYGSLLGSFCLSAGLPALNDQPHLPIPAKVIERVDGLNLGSRFVVIHCSSNESCRDWTPSHWNNVIDALAARYNVVIVEIGTISPLGRDNSSSYRNLCGKYSILESAEITKRALFFIGVDSGPAHIANAVGTFGVILLGHYLAFRHYTPYSGAYADGSNAIILRASGNLSQLSVNDVLAAVSRIRCHGASENRLPGISVH